MKKAKHKTAVITKHRKPVVKLVAVITDTDEIYNFLDGKGAVTGGVVSSAICRKDWGNLEINSSAAKRVAERRIGGTR